VLIFKEFRTNKKYEVYSGAKLGLDTLLFVQSMTKNDGSDSDGDEKPRSHFHEYLDRATLLVLGLSALAAAGAALFMRQRRS